MTKHTKICPFCANEIRVEAIKCQYCHEWLEAKPVTNSSAPLQSQKPNITPPPAPSPAPPPASAVAPPPAPASGKSKKKLLIWAIVIVAILVLAFIGFSVVNDNNLMSQFVAEKVSKFTTNTTNTTIPDSLGGRPQAIESDSDKEEKATAYEKAGDDELANKKYEAALESYNQALDLSPNNTELLAKIQRIEKAKKDNFAKEDVAGLKQEQRNTTQTEETNVSETNLAQSTAQKEEARIEQERIRQANIKAEELRLEQERIESARLEQESIELAKQEEEKRLKRARLVAAAKPILFEEYSMVKVQGGNFKMGSVSGESDEVPIHDVSISTFYISKFELTQQLWQEIMGSNQSNFKGSNNPVESVSWNNVQDFIKKLNDKTGLQFRLPTEAEWEFAARGGAQSKTSTYAGSETIADIAWYEENAHKMGHGHPDYGTHSVGQKGENELKLVDMCGNVAEWCDDWYDDGYYSNSSQQNHEGGSSSTRVVRGGSWTDTAADCRVANRYSKRPGPRFNNIGFRLAHD